MVSHFGYLTGGILLLDILAEACLDRMVLGKPGKQSLS
jgi:hypothetical protein